MASSARVLGVDGGGGDMDGGGGDMDASFDPALIHISPAQASALKAWFLALNWASLALAALTFTVNVANRRKRSFPARLTTLFTGASCGFHLSLLFGAFVDFRQLVPPEQVLPSRWCGCSFQGATFQFFASAMMWWWALICFNLWRVVRHGPDDVDAPSTARAYEVGYNVVGWGMPAASALVLLALNGFGTEVGALYCWVTTRHGSMWKVYSFYSFMAVFCVAGGAWGVSVIATVTQFKRRYKRLRVSLMAAASASRHGGAAAGAGGAVGAIHEAPGHGEASGQVDLEARRGYGSLGGGGGGGVARSPRPRVARSAHPDGAWDYYVTRQVLFLLVFFVRFAVFIAWEVNYKLFQARRSTITFPFAFAVNYLVGTLGFDCFWLFGLARDNRARLWHAVSTTCSSVWPRRDSR